MRKLFRLSAVVAMVLLMTGLSDLTSPAFAKKKGASAVASADSKTNSVGGCGIDCDGDGNTDLVTPYDRGLMGCCQDCLFYCGASACIAEDHEVGIMCE